MRNKSVFLATGLVVLTAFCVSLISIRDSGKPKAAEFGSLADAQDLANRLLPGSRLRFLSGGGVENGPETLDFGFSSEAAKGILQREDRGESKLRNVGWRARLIASAMATARPNLTGYVLSAPGIEVRDIPADALDSMYGYVPRGELANDNSSIGTITSKLAEEQIESNLSVIEKDHPEVSGAVSRLDIGIGGSVAFDVKFVSSADDLSAKAAGDLIIGPMMGLLGDDKPLIEGIAIAIYAPDGDLLGGTWNSSRSRYSALLAPGLTEPGHGSLQTRLDYQDLTDGPLVSALSVSSSGGVKG